MYTQVTELKILMEVSYTDQVHYSIPRVGMDILFLKVSLFDTYLQKWFYFQPVPLPEVLNNTLTYTFHATLQPHSDTLIPIDNDNRENSNSEDDLDICLVNQGLCCACYDFICVKYQYMKLLVCNQWD